ncbi:relaxase/mobilization nuclease domain-containing protein [Leeuwenhoekiella marinoflava]|uniref:Relaxase/mobilization nuclease-like protein n=2 Tax=Leeuwenhoekiella marinoflava TaxID=988 RepID=A0A4Q0PLX0_9FLAO|nr:relaxase/mobilization nuclease domain-containing protein [Leeuwenhoekiella marinoflava]RXG29926.1 relaxase/mobilization nuclease-like protein [Leeuwenhoekiella marinoflava]SHF26085.1 Relaxase/Mobilisation nuclease domain-containing protein [Leeuwenhoekiella marinoflava DSM 3653]
MIGKGSSISSTLGALRYGNNKEKEAEQVYSDLIVGETAEEIAQEFKAVQELNQICERNTLSFILSPTVRDGENLSNRELGALTKSFIQQMKLQERQAVAYVHRDKEHTHVHLYVNRIDLNGRAYNDSFIGKQSQLAAERTARELGLQTVKDVQYEKSRELSRIRAEIQKAHQNAISQDRSKDLQTYINRMREQQINVIPVINKSKQLQGFRFEYQGQSIKGSAVHRSMSASNLLKSIHREKSIALSGRSVTIAPSLAKALAKKVIKIVIDKGIGI